MAEKIKEINPHSDVTVKEPSAYDPGAEITNLPNLRQLSFGTGDNVLHIDESGLWVGAATFASAPFKIPMSGLPTILQAILGQISMESSDTLYLLDKNGNYIAGFHGRTGGGSNLGGLVMTSILQLYTGASDPTGISEGAMYVNSSTHALKVYLNGAWKTVTVT